MRVLSVLAFVVTAVTMTLAQSSSRQIITTGGNPSLPFSPAVKAGGLIYVAGMLGTGANGSIAKGDIKAQTKQTLDNIAATLKAAGSSLANATSVMVYLRSASDFPAVNEVYSTYWPKDPPARTTVVLAQPLANADAQVEISMVAVPDGGQRAVVHPSGWSKSPNPYSYGIKTGNTLFLSGLVSRNGKDNSVVKGDITAQTKTVLDNGAAILKEAGMTFADVVSARVFVTDDSTFQAMNTAYRTYLPAMPPARATVKTALTSGRQGTDRRGTRADWAHVESGRVRVVAGRRRSRVSPGYVEVPGHERGLSGNVHEGLPRTRDSRHRPHGRRRSGGDHVHGSEIADAAREDAGAKPQVERIDTEEYENTERIGHRDTENLCASVSPWLIYSL